LRGLLREDEFEALVEAAAGGVLAAVVQPEDAGGEDVVDGGGGLGFVDGDDSPGLLAFKERAARVGGAEGLFEIHGGAEGVGFEAGEVALEYALKSAQIAGASGISGGGSAAIGGGYELEEFGLRLAEALRVEAKSAGSGLRGEDAADKVGFFRPEVEGATVVVGGEGMFGGAEVEEDAAVFEDGGFGVGFYESANGRGDLGRGLGIRGGDSERGHWVKVPFDGTGQRKPEHLFRMFRRFTSGLSLLWD